MQNQIPLQQSVHPDSTLKLIVLACNSPPLTTFFMIPSVSLNELHVFVNLSLHFDSMSVFSSPKLRYLFYLSMSRIESAWQLSQTKNLIAFAQCSNSKAFGSDLFYVTTRSSVTLRKYLDTTDSQNWKKVFFPSIERYIFFKHHNKINLENLDWIGTPEYIHNTQPFFRFAEPHRARESKSIRIFFSVDYSRAYRLNGEQWRKRLRAF